MLKVTDITSFGGEVAFKGAPRAGFTLAEVLITLGIIGVVAAMTIPNLMTAYQKQQTEARLKQAYSVLTNAVRLSESENGNLDIPMDMGMSSHDLHLVFQESIAPYLAGASRISNTSIGWNGVNAAGGSSAGYLNFGKGTHCLNSGLCFYMINHHHNYIYIIVDLNGASKPNRAGRDIFYFALHPKDSGTVIDGLVYGINAQSTKEKLLEGCNKTNPGSWSNGSTCTELIKRNSWKIPKDYPW